MGAGMRHLAWLGGVAALAALLAVTAAAAQTQLQIPALRMPMVRSVRTALPAGPANCNPYSARLANGEALNAQGNFDASLAIAAGILKTAPNDFQTNFFKGKTLYLKAAVTDKNRWNPPLPLSATMAEGFDTLIKTAAQLPQIDAACVASTNPYSILNTIGAFYLNRGYFSEAQTYLLQAYGNLAKMPLETKQKVCDNLGLVYLVQLQPDPSIRYYNEAKSYGSTVAPQQIVKANSLKSTLFALPTAK